MNLRYIGAMMVVVRSLVAGLNLIVRPASGHPLSDINEPLKFAAMVPLQVYNTLQVLEEKERLKQTDILIIGGGAVDARLEADIQSLPGAVYSTYGMTETLSHIALRRLNGPAASEHYHPFSSVHLSLSPENTLVIEAPLVCADILQTNDIARIHPDGSFSILGRKDNVINSGGIKIQAAGCGFIAGGTAGYTRDGKRNTNDIGTILSSQAHSGSGLYSANGKWKSQSCGLSYFGTAPATTSE